MKILLNSFIGLLFPLILAAQTGSLDIMPKDTAVKENLFDYEHSKKFAEYLFKTAQYDYAIEEFQRVIFLNPHDWQAKLKVVEAYLNKEDYFKSVGYFHRYFPVFDTLPPGIQQKGIKGHILSGEYDVSLKYLNQSALDSVNRQTWKLGVYLLKHDWKTAKHFYDKQIDNPSPLFHQFGTSLQNRLEAKTKSPFLAGTLSTFVPGLGKVYTKNYGDALISFLFTGLNAWQSYRGFKKDGFRSVRGWIFGGFAASFYLGNIYGSVKAAKRYNKKIDDDVDNAVKAVIKYNM